MSKQDLQVRRDLEEAGVTFDEYGRAWWDEQTTDPYGHISWSIGKDGDFHCFDYLVLPLGYVVLHSTINSETGSFIQDGDYLIVPDANAVRMAGGLVDQAWTWVWDNFRDVPYRFDDTGLEEDEQGDKSDGEDWRQESETLGQAFIEAVQRAVAERASAPVADTDYTGQTCSHCGVAFDALDVVIPTQDEAVHAKPCYAEMHDPYAGDY